MVALCLEIIVYGMGKVKVWRTEDIWELFVRTFIVIAQSDLIGGRKSTRMDVQIK